ncbi:PIR protein [Plasmodium vivax]|uniref:VIR protein n=1 Tax=Plasmodium vivax TaxID=5855 RepID=A0A565A5H9_PLAVI|nr:PIR protein [Plasmodium vivax]
MNRAKWAYLFFDDIVNYISKAQNAEKTGAELKESTGCKSFYETWGSRLKNRESAKTLCGQFLKLCDSLPYLKKPSQEEHNYKKECSFLNYWVNFHIGKSINFESSCVKTIYDALESAVFNDLQYQLPTEPIYDVEKDELDKMNILYNLYENYNKLNAIDYKNEVQDKKQLLTHSTASCADYIKVSYICNGDNEKNNPKFCDKLNTFKSKHDALYKDVVAKGSDFSDYFIELSKCPNTKIITTAVTGSIVGLIPLLGVLYKFTPMGQVFRSKIGIMNNDISDNNEEMTNL